MFWGGFGLVSFFWCGGCDNFSQMVFCGIGGVWCSVLFLALFRGSSGRWVVVRGRGRDFKKVVQGAVTPSRFVQNFFTNND